MTLLFIEDNEESVEDVIERMNEEHPTVETKVLTFDAALSWMESNTPDIVSLDLCERSQGEKDINKGQPIYQNIWDSNFCPIIIYSANPDIGRDCRDNEHPCLVTIQKGRSSVDEFMDAFNIFLPQVQAIHKATRLVRVEFNSVLKEMAPFIFDSIPENQSRSEVLARAGRRRLAAQMDHEYSMAEVGQSTKLESWEHYLFPPISSSLLLGDVVRSIGSDGSAGDYRIVLTPSCDLDTSEHRVPKVDQVLMARCKEMDTALKLISMEVPTKANSRVKYGRKLEKELGQAYLNNILPMPAFASKIPTMAADLKDLELASLDTFYEKYERVASIDSPFRELISWAYIHTAGRPGLPDRNVVEWSKEIMAACNQEQVENGSA